MMILERERATMERFMPGLDDALAKFSLEELERPGNPTIGLFRAAGGAGLVIPAKHGGKGATALETIRVQRAVGSRAPSLGVMSTMHHFSVATIAEISRMGGTGMEWMILEGIARENLLVASGFAEGKSGRSILAPFMKLTRTADGFLLSGTKKPCSLAHSMDLLTASVVVPAAEPGQPDKLAVVLVPADAEGLERKPFWKTPILAGAESEEVVLTNVVVPQQLVSYSGEPGELDAVQSRGFLWFELIVTASYLGAASALVERVIHQGRGSASERTMLGVEVESAMAMLESVAHEIDAGNIDDDLLARALLFRYAVQHSIERVTMRAAELGGGMAFIGAPDVAYLLAAARPLAFHPPSRESMSEALATYLAGAPLRVP